ncbi:MAG TPA: TonB-dependent receptor [Steroidobacteraceae bacterium]|nr:TonB-dependent receptor [Steroidobacteraceae bacterium]
MHDSSEPGSLLANPSASRLKSKRRAALAALLVIGCAMSLVARAQTQPASGTVTSDQSSPVAQTDQTNPSKQTAKTHPTASTQGAKIDQSTLVAQANQGGQAAAADQGDQTAQNAETQGQLQEVVVTGTMIARPAAETAEAITLLNADSLTKQGVTNVEEAMYQLTTNTPAVNVAQAVGTFSGGGTYANLRGLGDGRTLVLLDGQRLAPNAFSGDAVDLSGIPFSAIDSVEVLREGASALYGSDAIAGVINFKTKKDYQGLQVQGNLDDPQESGGASSQADFIFGHGDLGNDGYNFMITGNYSHNDELKATQRGFSAEGFDPAGGYTSTNDPGTSPASIIDHNGNYWQYGYPACKGNPYLTTYFGNCAYRYSAAADLLPDTHEVSGLMSFTKTLPGNNQVQLQYFYTQSALTGWSGPMFYEFGMDPDSPYFPTAGNLTCISAYSACTKPVDLTDPITAVYTDSGNNRYSGNLNVEQRVLLTFSGSNGGWDYSGRLNWSRNNNDDRNVAGYPNEAVLAPGGTLSDLIDPFSRVQTPAGQALLNSSYVNGVYQLGHDTRWSVDGNASHSLGTAFNAPQPATFALGFDIEGERFAAGTTPYNNLVIAATGLTDSAEAGSRLIQALFAEVDVPMSKSVDLDVSDRYDRYSDFGTTNNGKIALRYQPVRFLTLRGTASTGFRAPTLFDLYGPNFVAASSSGTMGEGNPECKPPYSTEWSEAVCSTQGLGVFGGNRHLTPETSQNYDLGAIVQPIDNMGVTLDYYRIVLKNTIGQVPATAIYGNPTAFPNLIVTNSAGTLTPSIAEATDCAPYTAPTCGYILLTDTNTGFIATNGIDASIQYQEHTPIGAFRYDLEGTAVTEFEQQQYSGGPTLNLDGWFNELPPAYKWQHNFRVDWTSPMSMWGAGLANRYYSSYIDEFPDGNGNRRIVGAYSLWDIYGSYNPIKKLTILFGIKNLFNTWPPYTNAFQGNFTSGYNSLNADPLLRNFYLNLKYDFY